MIIKNEFITFLEHLKVDGKTEIYIGVYKEGAIHSLYDIDFKPPSKYGGQHTQILQGRKFDKTMVLQDLLLTLSQSGFGKDKIEVDIYGKIYNNFWVFYLKEIPSINLACYN